jgi:hypothetical protein
VSGQVLAFTPPQGSPEDIARERRIRDLADNIKRAQRLGPWGVSKAIELQEQMRMEIAARSPEQVERMERARGLWR